MPATLRGALRRTGHRLRTSSSVEFLVHSYSAQLRPATPEQLVRRHFRLWSEPNHVNRPGLELAVSLLGGRPAVIVETGTSAWGTDSTRLWDSYVRWFGGRCWSVDLSSDRSRRLHGHLCSRTRLVVGDSVQFLEDFVNAPEHPTVNLVYLDSWDVDWNDPSASEVHGLREWEAIRPALRPGSIVVIDDTPVSPEWIPDPVAQRAARAVLDGRGYMPGKGSLVLQQALHQGEVEVIHHSYNVVLRFDPRSNSQEAAEGG